ncbi:hypothetical protein C6496_14090 [Candidatus Poribacteria bacterium]|nr:MAG: hypothetical protein C6496_14090 [Candidatus Poribacteria bacterium]
MAAREGYTQLQARVLAARRVWKRTLFWTGCAIAIVGLIVILAGAAIVDLLMPLPSSVRIALLIGVIGAVGYLLYKYLIQPLRAKLTPHDVALNVERKHQDLEDRLVSALQFGEAETDDPIQSHLLQRLVTDAVERTEGIDFKATVDKSKKRKHVGIAVAALAGCALLALIFPTELNTSLNRLLSPWEKTEPVFTTKLTVEPGNVRILRGRSLAINLEVTGKAADKARLVYTKVNPATDTEPQRQEIDMVQIEDEKRKFGYELFNINENMEYYVTANGAESERYTVEVFDMPKVTAIEIAYTYPEYTRLKPIIQQGDGNIRAVAGSQAEVRITTNKAIESGTLTVNAQDPAPMVIFDARTLTTPLDVLNDGKYTVKLLCVDGFNNQTPIEYTITAIPDEPPEVVIKEPGRDIKATKLEEVRILAEATDDYGVEEITLMYSIGSGEAQELPMETVEVKAEKIISGAYVFYLEELDVEPGELISYYAQATDNNTRTGPGTSTSELYFIEVRPFNERYMQMDAAEGQQNPEGLPFPNLIADQRTIIKKTWKHIHSRPSPTTEDYQSSVKQIGKEQEQLKDKTQRVTDELSMSMRDANVDPEMLMNLEGAIGKMGEASDELFAIKPKEALPHEQDALELLTKAMMELDKVLTQMRSNGSQAAADNIEMDMEDLQDAIEQDQNELDEQMREGTQELLDQARDMLSQQEQLTEQSQQLAREGQPSRREMQQNSQQEGQLAGQAQQMAEQAQQMGQSVGQGAGNNTGQRMVQAGEALGQASENMGAASESMGAGQPQMGAAKGQKAEENLQQAIEELEKVAAQYTDQALDDVTESLDRLTAEQSEIREQTETLEEETRQDGISVEDARNASELANQQRTLRRDLEQLQRNLSNLREALNENEPQAARNVADANRRIIEEQASENMEDAQRALQWRNFQYSEREQREVLDTLLDARNDLQQARTNLAETEEERLDAALDQIESWAAQMEDIQRELEAMDNQETPLTPEQEARQQQLSEQQEQIQQRAQEAMEAQQPGDAQGEEQAQVGGAESDRELRELWLDAIRAMDNRPGTRRAPFPVYDFSLRELRKLERAIEERLATIQEKKQLAQVLKEDVPPEYRRLVDQYYESLAK